MESPFPHYGPLRPDQVHGRDELITQLIEAVSARRVTALLGPRRYGKTSVLAKVAAEVAAAGASVVWLDLFELASMADLAIRLDSALGAVRGAFGATLARIAASVGFSLGVVRFELARTPRADTTATVHALLDMLVESALAHPTLLVIDELSGIVRVDAAAGLVRTKLQHHFQDMGMLFAGSEPSTMRAMFSSAEQPLFGQADLVEVTPLSSAAVNEIVASGFRSTGRDPGSLGLRIAELTGGHPRRVMQLADAAWQASAPDTPWDEETWRKALEQVRAATAPSNETLFASLSKPEQSVLRILASGESIWGRGAERADLGAGSAQIALGKLVDAGHVSGQTIVDPLLADWLGRTLPI